VVPLAANNTYNQKTFLLSEINGRQNPQDECDQTDWGAHITATAAGKIYTDPVPA